MDEDGGDGVADARWVRRRVRVRPRDGHSIVLASFGYPADEQSDSHFRLVLGLPFTITQDVSNPVTLHTVV